jgi:hypothetical protein
MIDFYSISFTVGCINHSVADSLFLILKAVMIFLKNSKENGSDAFTFRL